MLLRVTLSPPWFDLICHTTTQSVAWVVGQGRSQKGVACMPLMYDRKICVQVQFDAHVEWWVGQRKIQTIYRLAMILNVCFP